MSLISPLDTYFHYVTQKMNAINSSQKFGGISNSADWPPQQVIDSALYLLFISSMPVNSQRDGSQYGLLYETFLQWIWLVKGTDLATTQVGANRADRYRTHLGIIENMRQSNYPGYTGLQHAAVDVNTGAVTFTNDIPRGDSSASLWWSRPKFPTKQDKSSGLIYGTCTVELYCYSVVLPAVA